MTTYREVPSDLPTDPIAEHRAMLTIEIAQLIAAPGAAVWDLISNVARHHEFTGYEITEVRRTNVAEPGPDFRWSEKGVLLGRRYECDCHVLAWEPPEWFCFGSTNLFHVSFELTPDDRGTRVTYRVELPQTPEARRDAFTQVCRRTVRNLAALLEGSGSGGGVSNPDVSAQP